MPILYTPRQIRILIQNKIEQLWTKPHPSDYRRAMEHVYGILSALEEADTIIPNDTSHFCIHQEEKHNPVTNAEFVCNYLRGLNGDPRFWCPFKTSIQAECTCKYYVKTTQCKERTIDERLDKLEQGMKCLQSMLKERGI